MKQLYRRFVAMILVVAMGLTMLPMEAFAEAYSDGTQINLPLADGSVPIKIQKLDENGDLVGDPIETTVSAGDVSTTARPVEGYDFLYAKVNNSEVSYLGSYNGQTYYSDRDNNAVLLIVPDGTIPVFYYEPHVEVYTVEYRLNGTTGAAYDGPETVRADTPLTFQVSTPRGCETTVTYTMGSQSQTLTETSKSSTPDGDTLIYEIGQVTSNVRIEIDVNEIETFRYGMDSAFATSSEGWPKYGHGATFKPADGTFSRGKGFTWTLTGDTSENVYWIMNGLEINGEDLSIPFSQGEPTITTLSTGTVVKIAWTKTNSNNGVKYNTYIITVSNAYEDIYITGGNFRASGHKEVMPTLISPGVNAQWRSQDSNWQWKDAISSTPIGFGSGNNVKIRYQLEPGYENLKATVDGKTNSTGPDREGWYYITIYASQVDSSRGFADVQITCDLAEYTVSYTGGEQPAAENLPSDNQQYDVVNNTQIYIPSNIPTADGEVFQGWSVNGGTTTYRPAAQVSLTDVLESADDNNQITFTAIWKSVQESKYVTYTINLYLDGQTEPVGTYRGQGIDGTQLLVRSQDGSWIAEQLEKYPDYELPEGFDNTITLDRNGDNTVDITLVRKTYTVTYDANGGTGAMDPDTVKSGEDYTVKGNEFTRTGYEFTGWNTKEDGNGDFYQANATIADVRENITLYAQWEQATATYIVQHWFEKVDSDEYEHNSAYGNQQFTGQIGQSTNATSYAVTGFTAQTIAQETIAASGTVVDVYYDRNKHDVTYTYTDAEGNTKPHTEANQTGVKFDATVTVADSPSVPQGYEFSGWTSTDVSDQDTTFTMPDKNVAFTGSITPKTDTKYTVAWFFEKVDGTYNDTPDKVDATRFGTTGQEVSVTAQDKEPQENYPNYVFDGENEDNVLTSSISGNGTTVLKLYFERKQFSVKYEYSGTGPEGADGMLPVENQYKWGVNVGVDNTLTEGKEVDGYVFSGWSVKEPANLDTTGGSFTMPQQDVTFIGSWTKLYTVTYLANAEDATGNMDPDVEKAGTTYTIKDCLFTRTEYNFIGWNTKSDGTGDYLTGNIVLNQDLTLYAQWEKKEVNYTIKYYLDDEPQVTVPYSDAPVGAKAKVGETVDISEQIRTEFMKDDNKYILDDRADNKLSITISLTESENVLKVYYASDNKGGGDDGKDPDDIPDKYQVIFRYVADPNGSITGRPHETITKSDTVLTAQPSGTAVQAADGYKFQKWTRSTDNTEDNDKEMTTFKEPSYEWGSEVTFTVHFTKLDDLSYTIHHYLVGTTVKVANDTTSTGTFQDTVSVEEAKSFISGYEKAKYDSKTAETITITTGANEATVYYKMPLTIKADDARRDYNGQPLTCDTFKVDGLVNDDNQNEISLSMTAESTITNVGTRPNVIDVSTVTGVEEYYEVTYKDGKLTIDPIDNLLVTISGKQKQEVYNGQTQNVSGYTAKFTVGDQEVTGVYGLEDFTYSGESTTASGKDVETYTVELDAAKFTWNDTKNFEGVSFEVERDIVLTITPKPITVTAIDLTMDYGKTVPTPKINKEDLDAQLANGDTIQYTPYIDFKGANEEKPPVGTYEIKFGETDGVQGNYNVTYVPATLTVNAPSDFPYVTKGHENGTFDSAGDEVTFNITVYNIYDVPAAVELREQTGVTFIAAEGATLSENGTVLNDTLDPNSSKTYQATYTVTQADLRNGKIDNTVRLALTVGEDTIYDTATDSVTDLQATATLAVEKTVQNPQASYGPGDKITYSIKVTNTGNQTLTDVTLTDTLKANEAVVGNLTITGYDGPFELTPGEFKNFTVTYEVKESDLGKTLVNTATATGKDPDNEKVTETGKTDGEKTDTPSRLLEVTKVVLTDNGYAPSGKDENDKAVYALGNTIHYQITVTNTGNVTLQNVTLKDVLTLTSSDNTSETETITVGDGTPFTLTRSGLEGSSKTFDVYYEVKESDLGKTLSNVATATSGETEGKNDPVVVQTEDLKPSLSVSKEADRTSAMVGETIDYTIQVTNNGNQTLNNIVVTDPLTGLNKEIGTLKPGEASEAFKTSYTVKVSDLVKGNVVNTATAKAGNVEASGSKTVTIAGSLSISVTLNSGECTYDGQEHTVSGAATVKYGESSINVSDGKFTIGDTEFTLNFDKGKGTATETDVRRKIDGTVDSYPVMAETSDITVMMGGQNVTSKVTVTNVTPGSLKINPRKVTITVQDAEKTYGESDPTPFQAVLSGDQLVNKTDLGTITCSRTNENVNDAGVYEDVLTASYTPNDNYDVTVVKGKFTIKKYTLPVVVTIEGTSAEKPYTGSEQSVEGYTITSITVNGVKIDTNYDGVVYPEESVLFVGDASDKVASGTYVGEYTMALNEEDFRHDTSNKNFSNVQFVVTPGVLKITDDNVPVDKVVTKKDSEDGSYKYALGETVSYTITVKNIYNKTVDLVVRELPGVTIVSPVPETLSAGEEITIQATYVIQEQDILKGSFTNKVTVILDEKPYEGEDPVITVEPDPKLTVSKTVKNSGDAPFDLNETITYTITVKNDGNVTAKDITVQDVLEIGGVKNEPVTLTSVTEGFNGELKPGKTAEFTYQHKVTQEDLGKTIENTATATAKDPEGENVPSTPGVVTTTTEKRNPHLKVVKSVVNTGTGANGAFKLDETIQYKVVLTNDGNVTLNYVTIRDYFGATEDTSTFAGTDITSSLVGSSEFDGTLEPDESVEFTYSYTVKESDLGKTIVNQVTDLNALDETNTPAGTDDTNGTVTSQIEDPNPDLKVEKTVLNPTDAPFDYNETIHYQITVSNTGNVTLTNVSVEDVLKDSLDNTIESLDLTGAKNFSLAPKGHEGDSKTFNVSYTVKEEDLGKTLVNTVTAASKQTQPDPDDPDNDDHDETDGEQTEKPSPNMSVTKEVVKKQTSYRVGDVITYQITVTNTGNTTIHNVELMDHMNANGKVTFKNLGGGQMVGGSPVLAALAPKTAWVVTCQYTVQLADADSDGTTISNKVTVDAADGPDGNDPEAQTPGEDIDPIYTLTIKYQNGARVDLRDPDTVKLHAGDVYTVVAPGINGYHLSDKAYAEFDFTMRDRDTTIVIIYARNPVEEDDDEPVVNPDNDPDETTEETEDEVDPGVYIEDPDDYTLTPIEDDGTPLADMDVGEHTCCIMHFLLMLAAMVVLGFYTDSKKKHQARIFELKRTLAMEKGKNPDGDNSQQS